MKVLKAVALMLLSILAALFIFAELKIYYDEWVATPDGDNHYAVEGCNVAAISLQGTMLTYYDYESKSEDNVSSSEDIVFLLRTATEAPNIEAILLEVDSPGGWPVAAQEIAETLWYDVEIPTVAQIRQSGLSGAYWAASATDFIFASSLSDVGGIGITQSYVSEDGNYEKEGFVFNSLTTGKFKDMFSPQKPLTVEERELAERDLAISHDIFVNSVAEYRGLPVERVQELADGSSMQGEMAVGEGLIDAIGGSFEVEEYLRQLLGTNPVICW